MNVPELSIDNPSRTTLITRAIVIVSNDDGSVLVDWNEENSGRLLCWTLQTSDGPSPRLAAGDNVLVWLPESDEEHGVVLGRIGPSQAPVVEPEKTQDTPDELVIEAKKNLTFKCGDGSITLRKDGKILIKGKDLVSRAKRMNRIKGGSVAIN